MAHAPDAFSSLRSCEGAGDADVMNNSGLMNKSKCGTIYALGG
jgi:hypothetical protein